MQTSQVLKTLREQKQMTQDQLAEAVHVTRQAVSRWETGETVPSSDTLKELSRLFGVSINTLLGSPRKLVCQCCGMPMNEDAILSREPDGTPNEDYCQWCYHDGTFAYQSLDALLDFMCQNYPAPGHTPAETRAWYAAQLGQLNHWKKAE